MLNLLPWQNKKELRLEKVYFKIRKVCVLITATVIVFSLFLAGNFWLLDRTLAKTQDNILLSEINLSGIENLKQDIVAFNQELIRAKKIQDEHVNLTLLMDELNGLMPTNIQVVNLSFDLSEKKITIQGIAKDRGTLLDLQENLNKSALFIEFDYPLGNLTEKEDINFMFEGKINLDGHVIE